MFEIPKRRRSDRELPAFENFKGFNVINLRKLSSAPGELRYELLKCDGKNHILTVDRSELDVYGKEVDGSTESSVPAGPCNCPEDTKGNSVFDIFR